MSKQFNGRIEYQFNIRKYNSWKLGCVVKSAYWPRDLADLGHYLAEQQFDWDDIEVIGLGSNILPTQASKEKNYIFTAPGLREIHWVDDSFYVEAGVTGTRLAKFCHAHGLGEAAYWSTIPGTLGGFVVMNAGAFGHETWDYITRVRVMSLSGEVLWRSRSDFTVGYRHVVPRFPNELIVGACFRLPALKAEELANHQANVLRRNQSQPIGQYSCGSVFCNPPGDYAARLVESCNLKGMRLGGCHGIY